MKVHLNGQIRDLPDDQSLNDLVHTLGKNSKMVIAEINGQIVKSSDWPTLKFKDGDAVELLNFVGGGNLTSCYS